MALTEPFIFDAYGIHLANPATLTEGEKQQVLLTADGLMRVSLAEDTTKADRTWYFNESAGAYSATGTIKLSAGKLFEFIVYNSHTIDLWLQFFDQTAAVIAASTWLYGYMIPAGTYVSMTYSEGVTFSTGIKWVSSTTPFTYTAVMASKFIVHAEYTLCHLSGQAGGAALR